MSAAIATWWILAVVRMVLDPLQRDPVSDPARARARRRLLNLDAAVRNIHQLHTTADWRRAQERLKYEEES